MKFVYWFAYYNLDSPSVRYRGKYALEFMREQRGIKSYFVIPGYGPAKVLNFFRAYFSALLFRKKNSLIVIQRINSDFIYANALKLLIKVRHSHSVYDLDDADYLELPPKTIYYFVKNCSAVSTGSHELVKNLSKFNSNIMLITSPVPDLKITKKTRNPVLTIGWIGCFGGGHKESLETYFFPALNNLPFKIKLVLIGVTNKNDYIALTNYFGRYENVELELPQYIDWTNENDIQQRIAAFDIGIATLLDNEMQRSKSAFKEKQYLNNGVPVLSSNVPENNNFIRHGENGYICTSSDAFRQCIIDINNMDNDSYQKLSFMARRSIAEFDLSKYSNDFISLYERMETS